MLSRCPGVVSRGEGSAAGGRRMAGGPEIYKWMRCWVIKGGFAKPLKPLLGRGLWVGDDAMNCLLSIHVGRMLDRPAEPVVDRLGEKVQDIQHQHKNHQEREVVLRADTPSRSISSQQPQRYLLSQKERDKQQYGREQNAQHNMVQRIMAELMPEDARQLIGSRSGNRRIPQHQTLGRPKPGYISVQAGHLLARLHEEHPVWRQAHPAPSRYLLQLFH